MVAGYNLQAGKWVFGVQADIEYLGSKKIEISALPGTPVRDLVRVDWSGHVLGRIGYDVNGWLPYVIGGAAFARVKASHTGLISPTETFTWRQSSTRLGYSYGAGVEKRFGTNWSVRVEYLYDYWGAKHYDWVANERYSDIAEKIQTVRIGFVKLLGPPR